MDGDGATDSTAHMYSNMADFLANDVKATPTAMGLYTVYNHGIMTTNCTCTHAFILHASLDTGTPHILGTCTHTYAHVHT